MKSDFHFHFYSRIFILLILAVSLVLIQQSVRSKAEITSFPYEVTGWAWNDSARWISLNCYNDFNIPGDYVSTCGTVDYKLEIAQNGDITGCIWGGNNLSGGESSLGWVCFNDVLSALRPGGTPLADLGVATSSTYLNALDPDTFASLFIYEDWHCTGTDDNDGDGFGDRDGMRCAPWDTFCSMEPYNGTCTFTDDQRWKLGFPISRDALSDEDTPSASNPIEGCFNCYEEYEYRCSINGAICDPVTTPCAPTGTPPQAQECLVFNVSHKCDNCLEYFYYPGRCEDGSGNISPTRGCTDEFLVDQSDCCVNNTDCNQSIGETCQPIYVLPVTITPIRYEYNCTDALLADSAHPCHNCPNTPFGDCIYPNVGSYRKVLGAYDCSLCSVESYDNRCTLNADNKNLNSCQSCDTVWYNPGVMIDNRHYGWSPDGNNDLDPTNLDPAPDDIAYMCGWAWNGWNETGATDPITGNLIIENGLYWFNFSPRVATSTRPFLSVELGNIYSQKGVVADYLPPFGYYNSSYLIESGGNITNFITSSTLSGIYQGEIPYQPIIDFLSPVSGGKYSNALGSIDYDGLITDVDPDILTVNKYGAIIIPLADGSTSFTNAVVGADQVYYRNGNLTINNGSVADRVIQDGTSASGQVAAKTVVVNGDLTIGDNILYETGGSYSKFKEIPSIVWVVKGDVFIDADVSEVVGTFIVLGNGGSPDCSNDPPAAGCGQFVSCLDTDIGDAADTCKTNPLVIRGNVLAKYFDLTRTYANQNNPVPSEQFINDGRLRVNPPGGFSDFSKIIPRFTNN